MMASETTGFVLKIGAALKKKRFTAKHYPG